MLKLTLVTPEKKILTNQEVEELTVPAHRGELNILDGHAPLITTLSTGIMSWLNKGETIPQRVVVSWGYCEISPTGVSVLADIIDLREDIKEPEVRARIAEAELRLGGDVHLTDDEFADARRQIARGRADLDLVGSQPITNS